MCSLCPASRTESLSPVQAEQGVIENVSRTVGMESEYFPAQKSSSSGYMTLSVWTGKWSTHCLHYNT